MTQEGDRNYGQGGFVRRQVSCSSSAKKNRGCTAVRLRRYLARHSHYNMFKGEVEVTLMNEMGYDAMTIGNHEFDFGLDNMARLFKLAKFPVVCANYDLDATILKDIVKPYGHSGSFRLEDRSFRVGERSRKD